MVKNSFDTDVELDVENVNLVDKKVKITDETFSDFGYNDANAPQKDYGYNVRKILTNPLANRTFLYSSAEDLINNTQDLKAFIIEHYQFQVPRLNVLNRYFMGQNISIYEAERRRLAEDKSDIRIANSYAKLIVETQVSYITSKPITIKSTSKDENLDEFIRVINEQNDIDSHNKDLLTDMSVYGRAYEHVYRTEEGDKIGLSDVLSTFIIYDLTIEKKPIAAVRYLLYNSLNSNGENVKHVSVEVYTPESIYTYASVPFVDDLELELRKFKDDIPNPRLNSYGVIPIVEYKNTNRGRGDFEDVIDLIDAYDSVNSDTANYSNDTPDSVYQIIGRLAENSNSLTTQALRKANISLLKPAVNDEGKESTLQAGYINPTYDVNGIEAFKNRLVNEIHKQSKTPDLTDNNFGGNQSGVAMQYKLYGIDQSAALKEGSFIKGAKIRYDLIKRLQNNVDERNHEFLMTDLGFNFTKNVPIDKASILESAVKAGLKLSNETLIEYLPFVNTSLELSRLQAEKESI